MKTVLGITGLVISLVGAMITIGIPVVGLSMLAAGIILIIISRKIHRRVDTTETAAQAAPTPSTEQRDKNVEKLPLSFAVKDYVVFDLETTGRDPQTCEITEIGALKVRNGTVFDTFSMLVKPSGKIPAETSRFNHITNDMVKDAPPIEEVMPQFEAYIQGSPLLGYNILRYDIPVLKRFISDEKQVEAIDVYPLVKYYSIPSKSNKLVDVAAYFKISRGNAHRALGDCYMTFGVFNSLYHYATSKAYRSEDVIDEINFEKSVFSITGDFVHATRDSIEQAITDRGGIVYGSVTGKTDYLIVGSLGSPDYTTRFGPKVQIALDQQKKGGRIKIVNEDVFFRFADNVPTVRDANGKEAAPKTDTSKLESAVTSSGAAASSQIAEASKPASVSAAGPWDKEAYAAVAKSNESSAASAKHMSLEEKSKMLMQLKKQVAEGKISQDEFEVRKNKFLFM